MGTFARGLAPAFVQELNDQYDQDAAWRAFVDDSDLYLAIRSGYVNIYYRGCSLLKWEEGHSDWKIHYKYLVRPNVKDPYVKVEGGKPMFLENEKGYFIRDIRDRKSLKKAACTILFMPTIVSWTSRWNWERIGSIWLSCRTRAIALISYFLRRNTLLIRNSGPEANPQL